VHKSTGFATSSSKIDESTNENNDKKYPVFDAEQICVYRDALPFYESLRRYSIGFDSLNPGNLYTYEYILDDLFLIDAYIYMNINNKRTCMHL
jgi:hypothetical protein